MLLPREELVVSLLRTLDYWKRQGDHLCQEKRKKKKVALFSLNFFVVANFSFEYFFKFLEMQTL